MSCPYWLERSIGFCWTCRHWSHEDPQAAVGAWIAEREALFLVGLLSLVDVILQVPMEKALAPLALSADIDSALRTGSGPLQPLLALAMACEGSDSHQLHEAAERCGIRPEQASECHMQALSWAIQIQD